MSENKVSEVKPEKGQLPPWYVKVEYGTVTQGHDESFLWFAPVLWGMALFTYIFAENRSNGDALTAGIVCVMLAVVALVCTIPWYRLFFRGYLVWMDCKNKAVRLTSQGYPEDAEGLVVKVCIRCCRPYLVMYWGVDAWQYMDPFDEAAYYINRQGTRIPWNDGKALEIYGLTVEVRELLMLKTWYKWRLRTPCAGTLLRFEENKKWAPRQVIDVGPHEFHMIPEILRAENAQTFWEKRRQREMKMEQDRQVLMGREQAVQDALQPIHDVLDLENPDDPFGPGVVETIKCAAEALGSRDTDLEQIWGFLCQRLVQLRARVTNGGRLTSRIRQWEDVLEIMKYLDEYLPKGHTLREIYRVNGESCENLGSELQELRARMERVG